MAHALRRPLSSAMGLLSSSSSSSPSIIIPRRCFSSYQPLLVRATSMNIRPAKQPTERSLRLATQTMNKIPSDLGLLEDTFVMPTGKGIPSPIWAPNDFLTLHWTRVKFRFRDLLSLAVLKFASPKDTTKGKRFARVVKLANPAIKPAGIALHRQMYTAFAEGDPTTLRKICTDGIFDSFRARIGHRDKGEKVQWELVRYNQRAKLVSNRAARLPIEGMAIRQAVVRIASTQRLTRWRKQKGVEGLVQVEGTGGEKDVVEYVVLQRLYEGWKEGPWMVWGTTKETTLEDTDEWARRSV